MLCEAHAGRVTASNAPFIKTNLDGHQALNISHRRMLPPRLAGSLSRQVAIRHALGPEAIKARNQLRPLQGQVASIHRKSRQR